MPVFATSFLGIIILDDVQIALRERDLDAVGVQGVVHDFRGTVGIGDALGGQDVLLHYDVDTTVAK